MVLTMDTLYALHHTTADHIKAAYVYKFTQFALWPDASFSEESPINICVLGDDPISDQLLPLSAKLVAGSVIRVSVHSVVEKTKGCSIVYVSESQLPELENILKFYRDHPILTVSSIENFAKRGGIIGFVQRDQRVQLEINLREAKEARIVLNAKLLEVASLVINGHGTEYEVKP